MICKRLKLRLLIVILIMILTGSVRHSVSHAQATLPNSTGISLSPIRGHYIYTENFPTIKFQFAIQENGVFLTSLNPDNLRLLENEQPISPNSIEILAYNSQPLRFVFISDRDLEQDFINFETFTILLNQIRENTNINDEWEFCSTTKLMCLKHSDENYATKSDTDIHTNLSENSSPPEPISLDLILRRTLTASELPTVIIIAKQRTISNIPYISNSLITDWLSKNDSPQIIMVNYANANDELLDEHSNFEARLAQINATYFKSGGAGDENWQVSLNDKVQNIRPTIFETSYTSLLFPDTATHHLRVEYDNDNDLERLQWTESNFRLFVNAQQRDNDSFVEIRHGVKRVDQFLKYLLPILLVCIMLVSNNDWPYTVRNQANSRFNNNDTESNHENEVVNVSAMEENITTIGAGSNNSERGGIPDGN